MQTKHRWLQATIQFATSTRLEMPWAMKAVKSDWAQRCAARVNATIDQPQSLIRAK